MSRPRIYKSEASRELKKIRDRKRLEKIKNNPEMQARLKENKARYKANMTEEQKAHQREYQREYKRVQRAKEKQEANKSLSNKDFISQFKNMQLKVACEQAQEN